MDRRFAFPGEEVQQLTQQAPPSVRRVDTEGRMARLGFDQYLADPDRERLGIACSGGGIRSASYCLGALQVLREAKLFDEKVLSQAAHMTAVSGGDYMALAHVVLVSETLRTAGTAPCPPGPPPDEDRFFGQIPPWAPGSPEEKHLRDSTTYLAPGLLGKVWLAVNLVYGMIRHLVPFAASLYLMAGVLSIGYGRWLAPSLRDAPGHAPVSYLAGWILLAALAGLAGVLLLWRQAIETSPSPNALRLAALQSTITVVVLAQAVVVVVLLALPALLLFLSNNPLNWIHSVATTVLTLQVGGLSVLSVLAYLARRGFVRRLVPVVTALIGPLVVGIPLVALTSWLTPRVDHFTWLPLGLFLGALALLLAYAFLLDETTPTAHLFYRERLATAFVGRRVRKGQGEQSYESPPWQESIEFSRICQGAHSAKLPNLVVCAAVNAARDVPPGRLCGSFTFERDFSGGPLTGYVATAALERMTWGAGLTMPAMMAISGAAVSPSMGRRTRASLRLLMAVLNARLGVWIPNPAVLTPTTTTGVREARKTPDERPMPDLREEPPSILKRVRQALHRGLRPSFLYVFREALGLNDVRRKFVYVTDGGHWENLGLVELLRRGCGRIICMDAAGDDLGKYFALSDAMALARSDLGVEIDIDLSPLEPDDDGISSSDHAWGRIRYPDGTRGMLVYVKAALPKDAPTDVIAYRQKNPKFPTQSTLDQFFDEPQFEAYRALGRHAAAGAVRTLERKLRRSRPGRPTDPPGPGRSES